MSNALDDLLEHPAAEAAPPAPSPAVSGYQLMPLKRFQEEASSTMLDVIVDTAVKIEADPAKRLPIALAQGVTLLRSPTGSGKTLTMGRTIERTVGALPRKTCWFWFAPYSGLVAQTRDALSAQCPAIQVRDLKTDRAPYTTRDGDVFIATWASVASSVKEAKNARKESETLPSVDLLVAYLRAEGWFIGVIVDEAHVNFGTTAKQAAAFYLDVLRPDFTLLATATPKDEELDRFAKMVGIKRVNRIETSRDDVVRACLNKVGVKAVHFRADPKDANLLDLREVALYAGLGRHRAIKEALAARGVSLTPLLMVQVDNVEKGATDPVDAVRDFYKGLGVPADAIAVHTSGEPDPFFHTLAYDETKEVLIFKMAAATGFDAPRAWTLVSLRTTTGVEFGHQVIGRIMRVHPRMQLQHPHFSATPKEPGILDYGYVYLANPAQQTGLALAAEELKALHDSIETVTDNVAIIEVQGGKVALLDPQGGFKELLAPPAPEAPAAALPEQADGPKEGAGANDPKGQANMKARSIAYLTQTFLDRLGAAEQPKRSQPAMVEAFGLEPTEAPAPKTKPGLVPYPLRTDIPFPTKLAREVMPKSMDGLVEGIARRIKIDAEALHLVNRTKGKVLVTEEDVFGSSKTTSHESVPLSASRIMQQAQLAFRFNDSIDERDLKPALLARLRKELDKGGYEMPAERDLRRAVDLLVMARPDLLHEACRSCLADVVTVLQDEEIPSFYAGSPGLENAQKGVYGVFPEDMNIEETAFARRLDDDETGTVLWWLRNVSNARWAVSIVLPNGKLHYPDFVIGVAGRKSEDHVALAEVKDDGSTGRLFSTVNTDKVRTTHARYHSALMVYRDGSSGEWYRVGYRADIGRHVPGDRFSVDDLVWTG